MRVTVLEAFGTSRGGFRGELIHPPGARALASLGMREPLATAGAATVRGFATFDRNHEPGPCEPVLLEYARGPERGLGLEHETILECLRSEVARRPRIHLMLGARVEGVTWEKRRVSGLRCADGSEHRAGLVVASDGRHSRVRRLLEIPTKASLLSHTVAALVDAELLPVGEHGHVFVGPLGPVLAYPCGGRARVCIDVPTALARGRNAITSCIRESHAPRLPSGMRRALLFALEREPLVAAANHAISARSYAVPGAALVGDAAGCSHPLTATGMTSALHDVLTLRDCLTAHGFGDDALVRYQRLRNRYARPREVFAQAFYEVVRASDAGTAALREGVFRYWRRDERARRASMAILSGDDAGIGRFLVEYARVVGMSGWTAAIQGLGRGGVRGAGRSIAALFATAGDCLAVAATKGMAAVRTECTTSLETFVSPLSVHGAGGGACPRPSHEEPAGGGGARASGGERAIR
jgi:2-polyprenyl-6-methoxyphenol hydroxylase-like FAD-dependent oxidoreductase